MESIRDIAANEMYNGVRCERATAARREFHSGDRAESPHRGEEALGAPGGWPGAKVSEGGERGACCPAPPGHSTIPATERKVVWIGAGSGAARKIAD